VGGQVAVTVCVYQAIVLLFALVNFVTLSGSFTSILNCLDHFLKSFPGVSFDFIHVSLSNLVASRFIVLAPVHLTGLENLSFGVAHWEARVLLCDLLYHLDELFILAQLHSEALTPSGQLASHINESITELPVLSRLLGQFVEVVEDHLDSIRLVLIIKLH
jgi:hypothetical protein